MYSVIHKGGAAFLEATLLFREFEAHGTYSLPEMSEIISRTINEAKDALSLALDTLSDNDRDSLLPLFRAHLPKTIADLGFDRVYERVPDQYIKNAIASCLASKLVYKEGTMFVSSQPKSHLAAVALKYLEKEKEMVRFLVLRPLYGNIHYNSRRAYFSHEFTRSFLWRMLKSRTWQRPKRRGS